MINKSVMVNSIDKHVTIIDGMIRLICHSCAQGYQGSDACWLQSGNNVGTMQEITQLVEALEQWPGGEDKKVELLVLQHPASFHMDEDGDRYLVVGCKAIPLADAKQALAELREIPNVVTA